MPSTQVVWNWCWPCYIAGTLEPNFTFDGEQTKQMETKNEDTRLKFVVYADYTISPRWLLNLTSIWYTSLRPDKKTCTSWLLTTSASMMLTDRSTEHSSTHNCKHGKWKRNDCFLISKNQQSITSVCAMLPSAPHNHGWLQVHFYS